jgi:hypothetical protein
MAAHTHDWLEVTALTPELLAPLAVEFDADELVLVVAACVVVALVAGVVAVVVVDGVVAELVAARTVAVR